MAILTYQPALRPALPCVSGPLDYREQRALFERIDRILSTSGLEQDSINLALADRQIDTEATSVKRLERFARFSVLALRSNIARKLTGFAHRDFCARLADSPLLQWFLHVGEVDSAKAFAKSSSDRFGQWVGEEILRVIIEKFTALLAATGPNGSGEESPSATFGMPGPVSFDGVFFDSACLKADIHFPIDWVMLRGAARTLMKATVLIRKHGLKHRMPQEPLDFLSAMNTLCMKMTAKRRAVDNAKQRKKVLREMKTLEKRIAGYARSGAAVEFGNKLWLGENREWIIVDYKLYQDNPSDSALAKPAIKRLVEDRQLDLRHGRRVNQSPEERQSGSLAFPSRCRFSGRSQDV